MTVAEKDKNKKPGKRELMELTQAGDFAALFISNNVAGTGNHGTVRGIDWPDYWWYSVLTVEKRLEKKICGMRTETGDMCLAEPEPGHDRCDQHEGQAFTTHNPNDTYDLRSAVSILMNRVVLSFIKTCDPEKCRMAVGCTTKNEDMPCAAELDMFHQLSVAKISDSLRVGLPMNMAQIVAIRRLVTNEIIMMRNDADLARDGTTLKNEKQRINKFGEEYSEEYVLNPVITANSLLAKQNNELTKNSLLSVRSQLEAKVASKVADAAADSVKLKAGKAMQSVLKEIHSAPSIVPGVGNIAELYGDIAGVVPELPDNPVRSALKDGEVVYDEDGNQMVVQDGKAVRVPVPQEIEI